MRALTLASLAIFLNLGLFAEETSRSFSEGMVSILHTEIALQDALLKQYEVQLQKLEKPKFLIDKHAKIDLLRKHIEQLELDIVAAKAVLSRYKSFAQKQATHPENKPAKDHWAVYSRRANRALLFNGFIEYCVRAEEFTGSLADAIDDEDHPAVSLNKTLDRVGKNMKGAIDGNSRAREELLEHHKTDQKPNLPRG